MGKIDFNVESFFIGGFECASHRRRDRTQIDVLARTRHDVYCAADYALLAQAGVRTVRDGLRWHLIEKVPGVYDWSSFVPMLEAAHVTGTQVLWDLCHWGIPEYLDPFSEQFPERFAAFAKAAASLVQEFNKRHAVTAAPVYSPINEISFWSWTGGDLEHFSPYGLGRGGELKRQLAIASIASIKAVRAVDPSARFLQPEPIINISASATSPQDVEDAARHTAAQFEAWDMISGIRDPELGGSPDLLDVLGVNYYWANQWMHQGDRTPPGHSLHRPLHAMLLALWRRYRRPIVITETGTETPAAIGWLGYVTAEVREAQRLGVPVKGICIYPVMDYPGWDDDRHCACGLIEVDQLWSRRSLRSALVAELRAQAKLFSSSAL